MAGFSDAAMVIGANAIKAAFTHGQLHTAAAGGSGTSNLTTAARVAITWGSTTSNGDFGLASSLSFTGGAASGPVYSITLWTASSGGTFGGEFVLAGDAIFNGAGAYTVTILNHNGSAS